MFAKACWDLWPILRSGWKTLNSSGWCDKLHPLWLANNRMPRRVFVLSLISEIFSLSGVNILFCCQLKDAKQTPINCYSCSFSPPPPPRGGTPYNGLYGEAPPERGTFFRLQVYRKVGISRAEVYERVRKSVI